jgi:hypothetical protein
MLTNKDDEGAWTMPRTMLEAYEHLLEINAAYEQVIRSLTALCGHTAFDYDQLNRFRALAKEARAASNSYLTSALETVETKDAGRHFRRRIRRERKDERGEGQ